MNNPSARIVKTSHKLWTQYIDAECKREEFDAMSDELKNSWLKLFGWI